MAETDTAQQLDVFVETVSVEALNQLPNAHVFEATAPAVVICEGVTLGPVRVFDKPNETWWLVRWDSYSDVLKPTAEECMAAVAKRVQRRLNRIEGNRARAAAEAKRQAKVAASIAQCPGHQLREVEIARCLRRIVCSCGYVETVSSDD